MFVRVFIHNHRLKKIGATAIKPVDPANATKALELQAVSDIFSEEAP